MNTNAADADSLRCPTCGATQAPSAECRRCKCDLSLVLAVRHQTRKLHQECLQHLSSGDYRQALNCALRRHELTPDGAARRLLAVAYLLQGQFQAALDVSGLERKTE